jgi:hypothetical protein
MRAPPLILRALLLLFLLFFLSAALPGGAPLSAEEPGDLGSGYRSRSAPWGTLYSAATSPEDLDRACREIGESLRRVEARLGRTRNRPFQVLVAPHQAEFARLYRSLAGRRPERWIAGVAFPARDLLIVKEDFLALLKRPADRPRAVLEHELAHLVLHRLPQASLPRWFDEGLAMWASRQFLEPEDEIFLSGLARIGGLHSLDALERDVPSTHDLATIAYQESLLLVEWIEGRWGSGEVGRLLDSVEGGGSFASAMAARTGLSPERFWAEFRLWLSGRRPLWEVLLHEVSLWTVAALLALLAILRFAVRRRRLLRKMEEAEREAASKFLFP